MQRRVGIQSRRLLGLRHLSAFFPEWQIVPVSWAALRLPPLDAMAGWGHKRYGRMTQARALLHNLPYIALEDGFVRSFELGVRGAPPWSLVVDEQGIYYDATQPSQLEKLILQSTGGNESLLEKMRSGRISKYNTGKMASAASLGLHSRYTLLVDQCAGDASLPLGFAGEVSFERMLASVKGPLVVKTHPDVISGKRKGYLAAMELPQGTVVVGEEVNPYCLFEQADSVHVATSLLGMEALIAGKPVITYGAPFYAGWGLTDDRMLPQSVAARRDASPSLLQLFSAAYVDYARYIDPISGQPSTLEKTIEAVLWQRQEDEKRPQSLHAFGFPAWKHPHARPFLARASGHVTYHQDAEVALAAAAITKEPLAVWAAKESPDIAPNASQRGVPLVRIEDGFVRSRGLGSDLIAASSLVCDTRGIYFDATQPSDLEELLNKGVQDAALLERARALRSKIVANAISKYNLKAEEALPVLPADKKVQLVIGQVEDDASIRRGGCDIITNDGLLQAVRAACPDDYILYKPHPDVLAGNRNAGQADKDPLRFADQMVGAVSLPSLLPKVDMLHCITSLSGFEWLLHGGRVATYGMPFYAGWGLTTDKGIPCARRTRQLSLDELVAAALILYPIYYDWGARMFCTAEQSIEQLVGAQAAPLPLRQVQRLSRWLKGWL